MRLQRPHIIFKTDICLYILSLNGSLPVGNGRTGGKSFNIGRTGGDPFKEWIFSQISVLNIHINSSYVILSVLFWSFESLPQPFMGFHLN